MAAGQSEFSKQAAGMIERLKAIQVLQGQIIETTRQIQSTILFGDHPELLELDDELDILYRGQI